MECVWKSDIFQNFLKNIEEKSKLLPARFSLSKELKIGDPENGQESLFFDSDKSEILKKLDSL